MLAFSLLLSRLGLGRGRISDSAHAEPRAHVAKHGKPRAKHLALACTMFAILLLVLFAGGSYMKIFPLRGLVSPDFADLPAWRQVLDYFWHIALQSGLASRCTPWP